MNMQRPAAPQSPVLRSVPLDAVRVVAMLAIVAGHVWGNSPARPYLYSWHVPVFFVLSGYLWKAGRPLGQVAARRAKSLLIPYAAWLLILAAVALSIESTRGGVDPTRPLEILWGGQFATGRPFWAIWFVPVLYFASVIYALIARFPLPVQWVIALALCVAAVYVPGQGARYLPLGLGLAPPGVLFIVAGVTLRRLRPSHPVRTGVLLLAVSFTSVALGASDPVDVKQLDLGTPVLSAIVAVAISAGLILLAEGLLAGVPAAWGRVVTPLARASLTVLFLHVLVLTAMHALGLPKPAAFVLTVCVTWGVGLLLTRAPHGWILTGVPPAQREPAPARQ